MELLTLTKHVSLSIHALIRDFIEDKFPYKLFQ